MKIIILDEILPKIKEYTVSGVVKKVTVVKKRVILKEKDLR